jgi:hypothetical protein
MMALEAFDAGQVVLNKGYEGKIFRELRARGYDVVPTISIATYAKKMGLRARAIIQRGEVDFWDYWRHVDPGMHEIQKEAYLRARAHGVEIEYSSISTDSLDASIGAESLLVVGVEYANEIKHALLVYSQERDGYRLIDPLCGRVCVEKPLLLSRMSMPIGRWYIELSL